MALRITLEHLVKKINGAVQSTGGVTAEKDIPVEAIADWQKAESLLKRDLALLDEGLQVSEEAASRRRLTVVAGRNAGLSKNLDYLYFDFAGVEWGKRLKADASAVVHAASKLLFLFREHP